MTTYPDLDWNSLDFVRHHLSRRLTTLLTHSLGRLVIAQHLDGVPEREDLQTQCRRAGEGLELALNLIKAWSALIHVKSGGIVQPEQRRLITPSTLPAWLIETLNAQTAFKAEHTLPVSVHPEVFYESLILIAEIAAKVGHLKLLLLGDAQAGMPGVWMRAIFDPPQTGGFAGLRGLLARLDADNPAERDVITQIQVLESLCAINGTCLKVQTNVDTGEQALAVHFVAASAAPVPCPDLSELLRASDLEPTKRRAAAAEAAPASTEAPPETLIVPPPGLRERIAALTENASETLIVPPLGFHKRLVETLNARDAAAGRLLPDTQPVPPPNLKDQIEAHTVAFPETPPPPDETPLETPLVPPEGLHDRIEASGFTAPETLPPPDPTLPETLIVPPPELRDKIRANDFAPAGTPPPAGEIPPETLIVPPPDLHDLISARIDARAQDMPPAVSEPAPDAALPTPDAPPSPPKSAGVEIIAAENASDTVILPPPDLQRQWLARKLVGGAPKDEPPPEKNGE